jgi:hypothetical protein
MYYNKQTFAPVGPGNLQGEERVPSTNRLDKILPRNNRPQGYPRKPLTLTQKATTPAAYRVDYFGAPRNATLVRIRGGITNNRINKCDLFGDLKVRMVQVSGKRNSIANVFDASGVTH